MQFSDVRQLVGSTGFPSRLVTSLGLNSGILDEADRGNLPLRYHSLCENARSLLNINESDQVYIYSSPGRLMYAGNHAESWGGLSLGTAVNPDILLILRHRDDQQVVLYSDGYEHPFHLDISELEPVESEAASSSALIRGAAAKLLQNNISIRGFDAYCNSQLLPGGGLNASASFTALMLYCLSDQPETRAEHPLAGQGNKLAAMIKSVEESYFGEEGDFASGAIIWNGGLQICTNTPDFSVSRIEQNGGFFDRRQYIVDSLSSGPGTEEAYLHLHDELRRIHTLEYDDLLNPGTFSGFSHEDIVLIHFFRTERHRTQQIIRGLRSGNHAKISYLYQEYLHEYRHIINLINRKSGNFNDKLELLHSIFSIYKTGENVEVIHGPFGAGIESKAFFMIQADKGKDFETLIKRFFDYLSVLPVFPREKGCLRVI